MLDNDDSYMLTQLTIDVEWMMVDNTKSVNNDSSNESVNNDDSNDDSDNSYDDSVNNDDSDVDWVNDR